MVYRAKRTAGYLHVSNVMCTMGVFDWASSVTYVLTDWTFGCGVEWAKAAQYTSTSILGIAQLITYVHEVGKK